MPDSPRCPESHGFRETQGLTYIEKARALKRACAFKSENPYFMIVLQPSYIYGNNNLVSFQFKACRRITSLVIFNLKVICINYHSLLLPLFRLYLSTLQRNISVRSMKMSSLKLQEVKFGLSNTILEKPMEDKRQNFVVVGRHLSEIITWK